MGLAGCARRRAGRAGVRGAAVGVRRQPGVRAVVPDHHADRRRAPLPVLRHVLPRLAAAVVGAAHRRAVTAVPRGPAVPGGDHREPVVGQRGRPGRARGLRGRRGRHRRSYLPPGAGGMSTSVRPGPTDPSDPVDPTGETVTAPRAVGRVLPAGLFGKHAVRVVERNALAYRRQWLIFLTGFTEPFLYLLSIGIGVGKLVGT